jgi:hypothetical protein
MYGETKKSNIACDAAGKVIFEAISGISSYRQGTAVN